MTRHLTRLPAACAVALTLAVAAADDGAEPTGAAWELRALGVAQKWQVQAVRESVRRPVTLAIVGQGGASRSQLEPLLQGGNTLEYRGAEDPGKSTHDTGMARVILELTSNLGMDVNLLIYQPGSPFEDVARDIVSAAVEADIVAFYQSFWGADVAHINEALRGAEGCLLISPYVEYQSRPTSTCPQALSAKPWAEGLPNFITVVPCARKAPEKLLTPSAREGDTEIVNFVAPSYYASGPGGTCPSAAVAAAVAAYALAAAPDKPTPADVVQLMRETAVRDSGTLQAGLGLDEEGALSLVNQIDALADPELGTARKLDAAGVLNLWAIYGRLSVGAPLRSPSGNAAPGARAGR